MKIKSYRTCIPGALEVVSLTAGKDGLVYGGFTGLKHNLLFAFDKRKTVMTNLGGKIRDSIQLYAGKDAVSGHQFDSRGQAKILQKIHHSLDTLPDGQIAGCTGQNIGYFDDYCRMEDDDGGHVFVFDPRKGKVTNYGIPVPHEWIICSTVDPSGEHLYGMTYFTNAVFSCNLKTGEKRLLGRVRGGHTWGCSCCHQCFCDADGNLYGSCIDGYLFKYDPQKKKLVETDIKLPGNDRRVDSAIRAPDGMIYGGTWENSYLFAFNPKKGRLITLGKPNKTGGRLPALVYRDGKLIGSAGGGIQYNTRKAVLFEYDLKRKTLRLLGNIYDKETDVQAIRIHTMTIDSDGTIFAGETGIDNKDVTATGRYPDLFVIDL